MKKHVIFFLYTITLLLFSCNKDVLEKRPLDIISEGVVWNDQSLIEAYLAQCYDEIGFINDIEFLGNRNWFPLTTQTIIADECTVGWEGYDEGYSGGKSFMLRADKTFTDWWGYSLVRKLNDFIEKVPTSPLDPAIKKQRLAEARFLRAYAYFNMVKRYGGIPLITEVQQKDDPSEVLYPKRDKEEDIYDFILDEIDTFINDLRDVKNDGGRVTKYAALALKSRAAMYAASIAQWGDIQLDGILGIPSEKAKSYWETSYNASKSIISSGLFELYNQMPDDKITNFRNIFLDENNAEVIFSEIYDGQAGKSHAWDFLNDPYGYHVWGCGATAVAYLEMVEEFEYKDGSPGIIDRQKISKGYLWTVDELFGNKDPRFRASLLTQGSIWLGDTINVYRGIIHEDGKIDENDYKGLPGCGKSTSDRPYATPFMMLKYLDESLGIASGTNTSKTDWLVFRYGEILLNFAEAAFELGKPSEAIEAINQLRERAGIALLTSIDRQKIRHERRVELAFEAHRYWDVRRWRTAESELSIPLSSLKFILDYSSRKFKLQIIPNIDGSLAQPFLKKHYYFPIGLSRTSNNPNLVENPGY